jgi:hypothetical protein
VPIIEFLIIVDTKPNKKPLSKVGVISKKQPKVDTKTIKKPKVDAKPIKEQPKVESKPVKQQLTVDGIKLYILNKKKA